jgi:hypothetical protein
MDKATLVNIDLERGAEVLKLLDSADLGIKVALWLFSPDHDDWFLVLASPQLDGSKHSYGLVNEGLYKAGYAIEKTPPLWIMPMNDPFIRGLRKLFGKTKSVEGMRLGLQTIGNRFIEDAYVYRIS